MSALEQYEVVGLQAVVEGHLGRRGARAESTAARRAAHLLARSGQVRLARVRVPAERGRRSRELLTISRTRADPDSLTEDTLQRAAVRRIAAADRTSDALSDIVEAVNQAVAHLPEVDPHTVDAGTADRVTRSLARPLRQLAQLRQELLHRRPSA